MVASRAILGISPGTRTMGLAVIRDGELIEWRVKTFKGRWSKEKLRYILNAVGKMCNYFGVTGLAIKKIDPIKASTQLELLTNRLTAQVQKKGMRIRTYSIHDLNEVTGRKQRNLHHAIAEYVLEIYPGLQLEYLRERNGKREYYSKMFEAVLCSRLAEVREQKAR